MRDYGGFDEDLKAKYSNSHIVLVCVCVCGVCVCACVCVCVCVCVCAPGSFDTDSIKKDSENVSYCEMVAGTDLGGRPPPRPPILRPKFCSLP